MKASQAWKAGSWLSRIGIAAGLCATVVGSATAAYPEQPVSVVVSYSPGGSSDLAARTFSTAAERYLDGNVVVQNRAGAGGIVGTDYVYNAKPDGHTLLLARVATLAVAPALQDVPYDPEKFTYLGLISKDPFTCVTSSKKPYQSLDDLTKAIQERPGTVTYSSSGAGTLTQLAAVQMLDAVGVENPRMAATHIPYKGEGPALAAVTGGHVDFFCGNLAPMLQQIQAGNVRAFFVTSDEPVESLPDVPTVAELGYPELGAIVGWSAIVGPPDMDEEARTKLLQVMQKIKADQQWQEKVRTLGSIPFIASPEETREFVQKQSRGFNSLAEKLDLRIQ
jgi:tripartite-type tricarboxylate transporter receptor subunit TctC